MLREIDDSLRRLRTDHVDVYLLHWPDAETPLEETMAALERGITSFDTAPGYGSGHAEETLGAALAGRRDQAIIITKCG
ncbi:MAG: aldo/keto reductase, partial [Chloroflexi bacterium]|nr:aldo/keto reductase [Chloroflexota bacterium]